MYMPELARFTARDPLPENGVLVGGIPPSSYWYANNDPANRTDPSGLQPEEPTQDTPANAPKNITGIHKKCLDAIIKELTKQLENKGAECFRHLGGRLRGRPLGNKECLAQLVPCMREGLKKIKFQTQSGGHCRTQARGGYTRGPCVESKDESRDIGCKEVCREGKLVPQYITDPGCGLCPDDLLEHSPVVLCLGPTGGRAGNAMPVGEDAVRRYCSIPRNRLKIAQLLLHEVLHNCVGGHKSDGKANEPDKCGRPDAAVAAAAFIGNCLQ